MSRLYLITGFLGAGKTTFLKQFMKQFSSERMHIIVNEFGKEGIDGELLSELGIAPSATAIHPFATSAFASSR